MKRRLIGTTLVLICALCLTYSREAPEARAQGDPSQEIVRLVNQLRASYGVPPFIWDQRLASAAQNQANFMATNNIYSHTGAGGSSPQTRAQAAGFPGRATENIVGGTSLTPGQGVIWWQNSPVHFNTLIAPHYTHVGVAYATGFDQNFYALVAGAPSDVVASPASQPEQGGDQLLAPVTPVELASPREDGSIIHVVASGQSFWAIAARYEVPLEILYLYNNLNESSVINPGDEVTIRLADGQEPPPTPTPPASHIVREGDSWWTIAAWHKLSVGDILWLNSASEDSVLQPGDEVRIRLLPGESPPPTATPQLAHVVRSGETAWDLSIRYDIPLADLLALNNLGTNPVLSIGDELLIASPTPSATATAVSTETPTATIQPTETPILPTATVIAAIFEPTPTPSQDTQDAGEGRMLLADAGLVFGALLLASGMLAVVLVWRRVG